MPHSRVRVLFACLSVAASAALTHPAAAMEWSYPEPLNTTAATDADRDYAPVLATDGSGHWVCVWHASEKTQSPRDFDIMLSRSDDNGLTWTSPVELDPRAVDPDEEGDDMTARIVTDGNGTWIATWHSDENSNGPLILGTDNDILVSRSTDNGVTWSASIPLNSDATTDHAVYQAYDYTPDLASDGQGNWVAVWDKFPVLDGDWDIYVSRSTDDGQTWSSLTLLDPGMATDSGDDGAPRIAADAGGHWVVVWGSENIIDSNGLISTNGTGDDDIFVSTSTNGIAWTALAVLNSHAAGDTLDDRIPQIMFDGTDRWVAVWYFGVYEIDYDIMVSHSNDDGATWSTAQYLNTNALTDAGKDIRPIPATDENGNWVVVWYSAETLGLPIGSDYDILFATSSDNAVTWSTTGVLNAYAPLEFANDRWPDVAYAGNGKWHAVWESKYDMGGTIGDDYDIMLSTACVPVIDGDHECDGDVDLYDFWAFQECFTMTGPVAGGCENLDFDEDDNVDLDDYAVFEGSLSGPGE